MTKYENYLDVISNDETVSLIEDDSTRLPAASFPCGKISCIFFNGKHFETDAERLVALAHENGHCGCGAFYTIHTPFETRGRCEHKAWKRAIFDLVPFDTLMDAFDACRTADGVSEYDLADYLGVTPEFVLRSAEEYSRLGMMIM